jgi:hypothetical protein
MAKSVQGPKGWMYSAFIQELGPLRQETVEKGKEDQLGKEESEGLCSSQGASNMAVVAKIRQGTTTKASDHGPFKSLGCCAGEQSKIRWKVNLKGGIRRLVITAKLRLQTTRKGSNQYTSKNLNH